MVEAEKRTNRVSIDSKALASRRSSFVLEPDYADIMKEDVTNHILFCLIWIIRNQRVFIFTFKV